MTTCKFCHQRIDGDNDCDCDETDTVKCIECRKEVPREKAIPSAVFDLMYFCKDCARGIK